MFQEGKKEKGHDKKRVSMGISRRGMLKSMGVLGVGLAATGAMTTLGCSSSDGSGEGLTFVDTVAWDGEYDVVVIGFGAAGATAATYAARDGAKVLIIEKEAQGGGDSAISDQLINIALDYDEAYKYNSVDLAGALLDEELLQMICQGQVDLKSTLVELGGDESQFVVFSEGASMTEHEGSSTFQMITMHEGKSDGFAYQTLQNTVKSMPDQIDVWLATPAKKLLQDPISKTIVGVLVERDKKDVLIRAKNGVVLAAGGYAFNEQMVADFNEMQLDKVRFNCSPNNTGEVIKMAMEIGADLWHMSHLNGNIFCAPVAEGTMAGFGILLEAMKGGSIELFGQGGDRIYNITTGARYGKYLINGKWQIPHWTDYNYLVFDQKKFEEISTAENNPLRALSRRTRVQDRDGSHRSGAGSRRVPQDRSRRGRHPLRPSRRDDGRLRRWPLLRVPDHAVLPVHLRRTEEKRKGRSHRNRRQPDSPSVRSGSLWQLNPWRLAWGHNFRQSGGQECRRGEGGPSRLRSGESRVEHNVHSRH